MIFCLVTLLNFISSVYSADLDLDAFFATTFIEKVKGTWNTQTNTYLFSCYKDTWNLYNLHHVCIKGGQDGIVVGLNEISNDWTLYSNGQNNFRISAKEWDNSPGVSGPIKSLRINQEDVDRSTVIKGGTLFSNCFQQNSNTGKKNFFNYIKICSIIS